MSGGHFEYAQYRIQSIIDSIEHELKKQGKEKPKKELWNRKEFYDEYPEEKFFYTYPKEIQKEFKKGVKALKIAAIYAQRIDWLLSGDKSEETFLEQLKEELDGVK